MSILALMRGWRVDARADRARSCTQTSAHCPDFCAAPTGSGSAVGRYVTPWSRALPHRSPMSVFGYGLLSPERSGGDREREKHALAALPPPVGLLELFDVELLHAHHGLEDPVHALGIGITDHPLRDGRHDLP